MSMAWKFSFLRDKSCRINVESQPSPRTTFGWPEGHGLGSSEGGDEHSISQESSCETNGDMNFTFLNGSLLGCCTTIGLPRREIGVVGAVFPNFSFRLPYEGFSWI